MSLPAACARRPIAVVMVTLALSTFGWLAVRRLPVNLLPDLAYPTLTIQTVYADAAPVTVEQFVTRPVEEAVGVVPGVREMRSVSRSGLSEVILEFDWQEQMDFAAMNVREKLGMVQLPREAERPRVLRFDPSLDPIVRIALWGDRPLDDLRRLAERWLKPRLEAVRGVAAARVRGGLEPEVIVSADEDRLAALGLTLDDLSTALQSENVNQPGGTLKDFHAVYLIRTLHEFDQLDQLRQTVVRERPSGRVRIEDVATVERGHRDREEITRLNGKEVVEMALHREGSANTVSVASAIQTELEKVRGELADGLHLTLMSDQSVYIKDAVDQVWNAALMGGLLAVLVLYFFLGDLSSTLIIALSIPVSVLATFLPMQQAGVTLNIMSLGGLALGVGMLVDNSIVVLEAIDRKRHTGLDRVAAAAAGASEVMGAVVASTLTTVSVFFPIVFVEGIAGQLFFDQAVTVCLSLLASLLVALTLLPALAGLAPVTSGTTSSPTLFPWDTRVSRDQASGWHPLLLWGWTFFKTGTGATKGRTSRIVLMPLRLLVLGLWGGPLLVQGLADRLFLPLGQVQIFGSRLPPIGNGHHWFSRILSVYLLPLRLLVFLLMFLVAGLWRGASGLFRTISWPAAHGFELLGRLYPGGLTRALRLRWVILGLAGVAFALSIAALPWLGTDLVPDLSQGEFAFQLQFPEGTPLEVTGAGVARMETALSGDESIQRVFSVIGSLPSSASGRSTQGENLAQMNIVLKHGEEPEREADTIRHIRQIVALDPHVKAELVRPSVLSVKDPVVIQIFSDDLDLLDQTAGKVSRRLAEVPGIVDVTSSAQAGHPEIKIDLDRQRAASLGVTPSMVGKALRLKIRGDLIGKFREGEERIGIRLRASEVSRKRASDVAKLMIQLPQGKAVPISSLASVDMELGPASIHRFGGSRSAEVTAKIASMDLGQALKGVKEALAGLAMPPGIQVEMAGGDRDLQISFKSLKLMLALAVFLVYVVMAAQFESLLHPLIILMAVPLGMVGVVAALWLTATTISVLALIGVVMLAGIVVNNAIVLVDAINRRRREGQPLEKAIVRGGHERLRPILMTTITTVLALLPMALGLGAGDELRAPLAITVTGGLTLSSVLTLVVIPCMYRVMSGSDRTGPVLNLPSETIPGEHLEREQP